MDTDPIEAEQELELRKRIQEIMDSSDYRISYTICLHELALCAEQLPEVFALIDALREEIKTLKNP